MMSLHMVLCMCPPLSKMWLDCQPGYVHDAASFEDVSARGSVHVSASMEDDVYMVLCMLRPLGKT
eukprot:7107174-Prorocentrum_lima.AAC.1